MGLRHIRILMFILISEASIEQLPASNASIHNTNPVLWFTVCLLFDPTYSPTVLERARNAFAQHLGIPTEQVVVEFGDHGEDVYTPL